MSTAARRKEVSIPIQIDSSAVWCCMKITTDDWDECMQQEIQQMLKPVLKESIEANEAAAKAGKLTGSNFEVSYQLEPTKRLPGDVLVATQKCSRWKQIHAKDVESNETFKNFGGLFKKTQLQRFVVRACIRKLHHGSQTSEEEPVACTSSDGPSYFPVDATPCDESPKEKAILKRITKGLSRQKRTRDVASSGASLKHASQGSEEGALSLQQQSSSQAEQQDSSSQRSSNTEEEVAEARHSRDRVSLVLRRFQLTRGTTNDFVDSKRPKRLKVDAEGAASKKKRKRWKVDEGGTSVQTSIEKYVRRKSQQEEDLVCLDGRDLEEEIKGIRNHKSLEKCHLAYLFKKVVPTLMRIARGQEASKRHRIYYGDNSKARINLTFEVHMKPFSEDQVDYVVDLMLEEFGTEYHVVDYVLKVLLPEALIHMNMAFTGMGHEESDRALQKATFEDTA